MQACIIILLSVVVACSAGPKTTLCLSCETTDPSMCTAYETCHLIGHSCGTEVTYENGQYVYRLGCMHEDECSHHLHIGRREDPHHHHPHPHPHGTVVCNQCCGTTSCNQQLCAGYHTTTTTTTTTTPPTTTPQDPCHDVEDAIFRCSDYDNFFFCTDPTGVPHDIAVKHCSKHCGFCVPGYQSAHITVVIPTATSATP